LNASYCHTLNRTGQCTVDARYGLQSMANSTILPYEAYGRSYQPGALTLRLLNFGASAFVPNPQPVALANLSYEDAGGKVWLEPTSSSRRVLLSCWSEDAADFNGTISVRVTYFPPANNSDPAHSTLPPLIPSQPSTSSMTTLFNPMRPLR